MQRKLKDQATIARYGLAQLRSLLVAQSVPSVSKPMLIILVSWLVVIFLGFSVLAPPNRYCHPRFDGLGPRCLRRYFPDPGAGSSPLAG